MALLFWMLDGFAAGWLTGRIMTNEGRDRFVDIVMGSAGAVAGGFMFGGLHLLVRGQMIYTNLAALMGAISLTILARYFGGRREIEATN